MAHKRLGMNGTAMRRAVIDFAMIGSTWNRRNLSRKFYGVFGRCGCGSSLREIAAKLNRDGVRTRSGGTWRHEYVARVLRTA